MNSIGILLFIFNYIFIELLCDDCSYYLEWMRLVFFGCFELDDVYVVRFVRSGWYSIGLGD